MKNASDESGDSDSQKYCSAKHDILVKTVHCADVCAPRLGVVYIAGHVRQVVDRELVCMR